MKLIRLTSTTFNNVVMDIFGEPGFLPLRGYFYRDEITTPKICSFKVQQELTTLEWQLSDLIAVIKSSSSFPIQDFRFHGGCIKNSLLQEFFSLYGFRIRRLYLDVHFTETGWFQHPDIYSTQEELFTILRAIPDVEHLELVFFSQIRNCLEGNVPGTFLGEDGKSNGSNKNNGLARYSKLHLSNLRILKLDRFVPDWLFLTLIESSPKLKQVRIKWGGRECYLTSTNKLHLLRSLHLSYNNVFKSMPNLENVFKIISHDPSVSLLKMQVQPYGLVHLLPSVGLLLSQLFHSNQYTLKSLKLGALGNISQLQIPKLPKLLKLEIVQNCDPTNEKFFPPNVDMSKIFPNLKSLIIRIRPGNNPGDFPLFSFAPVREYFAKCPSLMPTVESIVFRCDRLISGRSGEMYPSDFIEFFAKLCPRVTSAEFRGINSLTQESRDIWKFFGKLTYLKFSFDVCKYLPWISPYHGTEYSLHSINTFITGISVYNLTCLSTWKTDGRWNDEQLKKIQEMRIHPSILLLKDLKRLEIIVYNVEQLDAGRPFVPTLTDASKYFGFDFCPQLHATLSFQLQIRSHLIKWKEVTKSLRTQPARLPNVKYQASQAWQPLLRDFESSKLCV